MKAKFSFDPFSGTAVFKVSNNYSHSSEEGDVMIERSSSGSVSGARIYDAAKFFGMNGKFLLAIKNSEISETEGKIQVCLKGRNFVLNY